MPGWVKALIAVFVIFALVAICFSVYTKYTPAGVAWWESYKTSLHKAKDNTNYETRKAVEDRCRSLIANYEQDYTIYNTYKDSEDEGMRSIAEQAYIRLSGTVHLYNEYILENSFVWEGNIPADIDMQLTLPER